MLSPVPSQMSTRKAKYVLVFTDKSDSTRPGPFAHAALSLKAASCLIDGKAVACDDNGLR